MTIRYALLYLSAKSLNIFLIKITIGCAIPNCEQCKESNQNVTGECTKCAGVFVLNNGICNDSKLLKAQAIRISVFYRLWNIQMYSV